MRALLALNPPIRPEVDMQDFLDPCKDDEDSQKLSFNQQLNLITQQKVWREYCEKHEHAKFCVFDVARDPSLDIDSKFMVNHCATFRTNNGHLWLLPRKNLASIFGEGGRLLTGAEKSRMAGFLPDSLKCLTKAALEKSLGNTIPVALIGDVLANILAAWTMKLEGDALCEARSVQAGAAVLFF